MHSTNGRADLVGSPIQLGDFLPERREVMLNGQRYLAWVTKNRRFPRSVQAELDQARNRYMRVVGPLVASASAAAEEGLPAEDVARLAAERERAIDQADLAFSRYETDALVALIPGLSEQEADLIDQETTDKLLIDLGYFTAPKTEEPSTGAVEDAAPLTGASSPPDLPTSTQAVVHENS